MKNAEDEYFIDKERYYVTKKLFRGKLELKQCPNCGEYLNYVYAEKYSSFGEMGMMIMGLKIYGLECNSCHICFINSS